MTSVKGGSVEIVQLPESGRILRVEGRRVFQAL